MNKQEPKLMEILYHDNGVHAPTLVYYEGKIEYPSGYVLYSVKQGTQSIIVTPEHVRRITK
jgi:hypothetical protein